jgi:outer membrane protein assembly factor BamB
LKTTIICLTALLAASAAVAAAGDWPAWRGPSASGSTIQGEYLTGWTLDDVTWKAELPGNGGSTPIVWQDRILLTTPADGQDAVMALDSSGRRLWLTQLGPESPPKHRSLGSSCNASPVTDGDGVFARFRSGRVVALNMDGSIRWQFNIEERFGPEELFWDQGSSPTLTDDLLIVSRLHAGESWVAGFDKKTGEQRWLQQRNYEAPAENDNGYTTPLVFEHQGKPALLIWAADHLTAHSVEDGRLLWECGGFNPAGTAFWPAIATPVLHGGVAVVPVGRDDRPNQVALHGIRVDGSGDVTQSHRVWERDDVGVFCSTPSEYKGRVYLLRHRGGVVCVDPATGQTIWEGEFPRHRSSYYSSPVIANGVMYAVREDGTVFTARVDDGFELLDEIPMGERTVASPVLANNSILIRGSDHLFCITTKGR